MSKLNAQQRLFAHEYVRCKGNATEAAKNAGYSARSAYSQGHDLLKKPEIKRLVAELEDRQLAKVDASAERVKEELARIAFVDVSRAYDAQGRMLPLHEIPEDVRRALAGLDLLEGGGRRARFWSKTEALGMLAKHHGLLKDVVEVKRDLDLDGVTDKEWELLTALVHRVRKDGAGEG